MGASITPSQRPVTDNTTKEMAVRRKYHGLLVSILVTGKIDPIRFIWTHLTGLGGQSPKCFLAYGPKTEEEEEGECHAVFLPQ